MGQYYHPIILKEDDIDTPIKSWKAHDYGNGLKLMEHSLIDNNFVATVEYELYNNPQRLVWEGDYADEVLYDKSNEVLCYPSTPITFQDIMDGAVGVEFDIAILHGTYVVNHDKKQFYKRPEPSDEDYVINPLPILTNEGNGNGGGDYFGEACKEMVGTWARDVIELTDIHPTEDYTEIFPNFQD